METLEDAHLGYLRHSHPYLFDTAYLLPMYVEPYSLPS